MSCVIRCMRLHEVAAVKRQWNSRQVNLIRDIASSLCRNEIRRRSAVDSKHKDKNLILCYFVSSVISRFTLPAAASFLLSLNVPFHRNPQLSFIYGKHGHVVNVEIHKIGEGGRRKAKGLSIEIATPMFS